MPSIQSRLVLYQKENLIPPLTQSQKIELGKLICSHYREQNIIKYPVQRVVSNEPEGPFLVLSYPHVYVPEVDRMIKEFYSTIPMPKTRKRTNSPALAYSTKKSES